MTNLTHSSFLCVDFNSLHVSSNLMLIRRINCINTTSGACQELSDLHTKRSSTQSDIYQMYWYNWFSWWWAWGCSKHVENLNKHIEKNCASSWSFTKNHNKMHGQQNIKLSRNCPQHHRIQTSFLAHIRGSEGSVLETKAAWAWSWLVYLSKALVKNACGLRFKYSFIFISA